MCSPAKFTAFAITLACLGQPLADAQAQGLVKNSANVNPFAPRPAPAVATSAPSIPATSSTPSTPALPPPTFASSKLPPLPLPPPPDIPPPPSASSDHLPAGAAFRGEEHNTIGRARQAASCHLAMTRTEARVDANGGPVTLKLAARTGKDCAKAAMADEAWIDVANLGDRAITFQIQPNTTGLPREGHVRVVSPDVGDAVTVKITQRPDAGDEK